MSKVIWKTIITLSLGLLAAWVVIHGWQARRVALRSYDHTMEAADHLQSFSVALYDIGNQLWFKGKKDQALNLFHRAVSRDFYNVDAWLRLAEVEAQRGRLAKAKRVLEFTEQLAPDTMRWKWPQALLADTLGMKEIFRANINRLIESYGHRENALFMVDQAYQNDAVRVAKALAEFNHPFYLQWLINGRRTDDAQTMWRVMNGGQKKEPTLLNRYVHFLLHNQRVADAKAVWQQAGYFGITNPRLESEIVNQGFHWRLNHSSTKDFIIKRKYQLHSEREYIVQIQFTGQKNVNFRHFSQVIAVDPGKRYKIKWEWKSRQLTTAQRPFMEIRGFDCKELDVISPMCPESTGWRQVTLSFKAPESCHAAVMRLRRIPSKRFDSKIKGTLWLDNFSIHEI